MLNFDRPITTVSGRKVRILCTDAPGTYPVVGIVEGCSSPSTWTKEGVLHIHNSVSDLNLVNRVEKRSIWVNVYPNKYKDASHRSRGAADECSDDNRIACIELTYEVPN